MEPRAVSLIIYGESLTDIDNKFKESTGIKLGKHNLLSINVSYHSDGICAVITVWNNDKMKKGLHIL